MAARVLGERYELLHEIGKGGMGTVFAAHDRIEDRPCAIKVLREDASFDPDIAARFEREARAPARIGHPGLCEVFDAFVDEHGRMVLVMERLHGSSLKEIMARGALLQEKLAVILGALDPLAAAHAAGFVHRDMKPDNVFLTEGRDGERCVKILDFGIARDTASGALTRTGVIVGSAHYISPEQAHSARTVEPSADVFSMGVMLYEAATGELPFGDESALKTLTNLAAGRYTPLDERVGGLPKSLVDLVHECLALQPTARPGDAAELRDRLAPIVSGSLPPVRGFDDYDDEPTAQWSTEVRSVDSRSEPTPPPDERPTPGRRAKGASIIPMMRAVKVALRQGIELPLSDEDRAWLDQRLLVSGWYPYERFQWLIELVHAHLAGRTDGAAVWMGASAARELLTGVHASFLYEGDVPRTLRSLPNSWSRYFDFGTVEVEVEVDGLARARIEDYTFISPVHERMLIGWVEEAIRLAGGEVVESVLTAAPSLGDDELAIRVAYRTAQESNSSR